MTLAPSVSQTPVLAFFTSPTSGPARRMESLMAMLGRRQRGRVRIRRVDITEAPELAERLKVTSVPTLLLIRDKRVIARLDGRVSVPRIERMLEESLGAKAGAPRLVPSGNRSVSS
jgi:thioredoxin-like negative regulator of GroEL